ncbi:hypothetical protein FDC50_12720 [Clostridium botulinum]|uniref:Uncharacterized protein n=1 Tax=Clostridium botulinum TaxID=1491 RepID=A0A093VMI4_CLOBO|nr:hypothetical protein [Clostridium botulinum]AIW54671.1 hypothetical protein [Clostridium botulinum]AIW54920.1 hypothetical protein [Clostridium botulinum]AIW54975.1 hypothetical protein [Clostridium botulinum]AIW55029.1 hypothetical protein [Clostridium botulinum]KFX53732.1 hypothetical protein KU40_19215 [Clostridium botulinum]
MKFLNNLNKDKKIIIVLSFLLLLVFAGYQTNSTIKNIKIKNLENEINELSLNIENSNRKVYAAPNFTPNENIEIENKEQKEIINIESNENDITIKERFTDIAKNIKKEYDESINDTEAISFETMDLSTLTDNQIKKTLEKLPNKKFNIKIEENKLGNNNFYKIILLQ